MADADEFARAVTLHAEGRGAEAETLCRAIVDRDPPHPRALHLLGAIRWQAGDREHAIALLRRAVAANPAYAEAEFNLGAMLAEHGLFAEAADHYARAAALRPDHVESHARLAATRLNLGQLEAAEEAYGRVLALQPDHAAAHADRSTIALRRGDLDEAVRRGRRAIDVAPAAITFFRLGRALCDRGDHAEGISFYRRALAAGSGDDVLYWRNILNASLYSPGLPPERRRADRTGFRQAVAARVVRPFSPAVRDRDPGRRLRVGWLSSDLRVHPVGFNLQPLFAHRDAGRFEYVCYADVSESDDLSEWFRSRVDVWRPIGGRSDADVASLIHDDAIDLMIYVAGHFDLNRPQVAAWRPAPVQISMHDPATSALAEMDYLIADPVLVPRRSAETFAERVVRVPSFVVHAPISAASPAGLAPARANGFVTFGSFNNPAKLNDRVLAVWADILRRVPQARLRFKFRNAFGSHNLRRRVSDAFPGFQERIQFLDEDLPVGAHLAQYQAVDIALDPFPFTGSTTTFEALWMGVPVVTLAGDTMVGRWSASVLHALALDELISRSPEEYVALAVRLAEDGERRAALRAGLGDRVARSRLCDGPSHTRHFEHLLRALWRRRCREHRA